jgi:DNA-directed RNA polymerase specialized sigma24 family protein
MENNGQHPHSSPLLVSGLELQELREEPQRTAPYRNLYARCIGYVLRCRRYGCSLSAEDGEDIASQALLDELHCIADPRIQVEEVSSRLKRAINRVRARYLREHGRRAAAWPAVVSREDLSATVELKEIARLLQEHIRMAFNSLGDRDRSLLIDCYGLEQLGFARRGPSPVFASAGGFKVALWRARRRFFAELERLLATSQQCTRDAELADIFRAVAGVKPRTAARALGGMMPSEQGAAR